MQTRSELMRRLEETKRQIDHGDRTIGAQQRVIASLLAGGHDATLAEERLDAFEKSQEMRLTEMDRLLCALDKIPLDDDVGAS